MDPEPTNEIPPTPDPDPGFYQKALTRIPKWIALVTVAALPLVGWRMGAIGCASFLTGAIGGYWNFVAIRRLADRLAVSVERTGRAPASTLRLLLRLGFIALAAFVIIRFTRINLTAAFFGLFTPVAAVVMEIIFEICTSLKSG
jgi:hypothetical protein